MEGGQRETNDASCQTEPDEELKQFKLKVISYLK